MAHMVHASAVSISGEGVLLLGPSGAGKSDLALRLIDRGAVLVSDDIVYLEQSGNAVAIKAAANIAGKIEVRGIGICELPYVHSAPLRMAIDLEGTPERVPPENQWITIGDFSVPLCQLHPFEQSSALKVELAVRSCVDAAVGPKLLTAAGQIEGPEN